MADRNSIIEKIKALLSKTTANGCTEAEMFSALRMARTMQDTYVISDEELKLSREEKVMLHRESKADALDPHRIKWGLASGVQPYCNVHISRNKSGLEFIGFRSDTDFARWLLEHLADYVYEVLNLHMLDHDCLAPRERNQERSGFVVGCTDRINATLIAACEQSKTARTTSGKELMIIKDQAIKDFIKANDLHFRCVGGSSAAVSDSARAAGDRAGYGATFGRPVSGAGATLRLGKT